MEGRRSSDVEQSFRAASTGPVRPQDAACHASQPDQGQRADRLIRRRTFRKQMKLQELTLRTVQLPLVRPYVLSYRTFTEFEPIIVEARDADGRIGWGEGHISPGSSSETREGGWAFCQK